MKLVGKFPELPIPPIIDAEGTVVFGEEFVLAARANGLQGIPVTRVHHLSPEMLRLYAIEAQKLIDMGTYDEILLAEELRELEQLLGPDSLKDLVIAEGELTRLLGLNSAVDECSKGYCQIPLSLRNVEDLLFERGIDICHETVRHWWNRFGPLFAADIRRQRVSRMRGFRHWKWHLDEMVYLWRAVDHEGEVLESYITRTRDKAAAVGFMKKAMKRHGSPEAITTDGLRSYKAAMTEFGNSDKQEVGRWANNRVENSHLPFRRRERAMQRFRRMKTLQKFASVHASMHNHFNHERHLVDRKTYKLRRSAALAE